MPPALAKNKAKTHKSYRLASRSDAAGAGVGEARSADEQVRCANAKQAASAARRVEQAAAGGDSLLEGVS